MRNGYIIPKHDGKDIGWMKPKGYEKLHYFRTNGVSRLAMSHCEIISPIDSLSDNKAAPYCFVCSAAETIRNEADQQNKKGRSIDK